MKMNLEEEVWWALSKEMKFIGLYSEQLMASLKTAVQSGKQQLHHRLRRMEPGDVTDYTMVFNLDPGKGWIGPEQYDVSVRVTPAIDHMVTGGIDTGKLEQKLASRHWDKEDALWGMGISAVGSEINELVGRICALLDSSDPKEVGIGQQLAAKYWLHTPMEQLLDLSAVAAACDRSHQFSLANLRTAIPADRSRNLLLGRSVAGFSQELYPCWFYMDFNAPAKERMVQVEDYSIGGQLAALSVKEVVNATEAFDLLKGLMAGERMAVHPLTGSQGKVLQIEVSAKGRELLAFDSFGKPQPISRLQGHETQSLHPSPIGHQQLSSWLSSGQQKKTGPRI